MASAGSGSSPRLAGELFKLMTGIDMVHVPYRGGAPALTDLIGGQVQVHFSSTASSIEYIKADKIRPLGVTSAQRSVALPDVPTIAEFVPGYEASAWYGFGAQETRPLKSSRSLTRRSTQASAIASAACRIRRAAPCRLGLRIWCAACGGDRQMGQGG
jgi:tripartite-type tricarboxylate transporter receptor subunit TctC